MAQSFRLYKTIVLMTMFLTATLAIAYVNNGLNFTQTTNAAASQSQVLSFNTLQMPTTIDEDLIFDINYSHSPTLDVKTSGVSFRLHWDSSQLEFQSISNLLTDSLLRQSVIRSDSLNFDNDELTDVYILFTWFDENQQWPLNSFNPILLTGNFKTTLNFVSSTVKVSAVTKLPDMELSPGVITSWNLRSQSLTVGVLPNEVFSNGFELIPTPTYLPQNIFSGDDTLCSTDIDGNGILEPLTDGILVSRFINGITSDTLIDGALGQGATRITSAEIVSFLQMPDCQNMLDIDANGTIEAGFDDVLFARWLFGYTGNDLTEGALGVDFQRDGITDLITWFGTHSYFRTIIMDESIPAGTQATSSDGSVVVEPIDNDVDVSITTGEDEEGDLVYHISTNGDGLVQFTFDSSIINRGNNPQLTRCSFESSESNYPVSNFQWSVIPNEPNCAYYLDGLAYDFNRLPNSSSTTPNNTSFTINTGFLFDNIDIPIIDVKVKASSQLTSSCNMNNPSNECLLKKPILFIHGYSPDSGYDNYNWPQTGLGGGKGTWDNFPKLMEQLGFTTFEFRWRTAAKFEDVAAELVEAITLIEGKTGQEVNIIAHSFGGILTRTMMQGLATDRPIVNSLVDRIVTIGTPHSGIADSNTCFNDKVFPIGQASSPIGLFELCQQISCHQMGETAISLNRSIFGIEAPGSLMSKLACITTDYPNCSEPYPLQGSDILVLIGMRALLYGASTDLKVQEGDGLISYQGQRFLPQFTVNGTCGIINNDIDSVFPLILEPEFSYPSGARVREKMLGTTFIDVVPDDIGIIFDYSSFGFKHSYFNGFLSKEEVNIPCDNSNNCEHPTFLKVSDWFMPLTLTVNQSEDQDDPTAIDTAIFSVEFSKPIKPATFTESDLQILGASSGAQPLEVIIIPAPPYDDTNWEIVINFLTSGDTISVSIPANTIEDKNSFKNAVSISVDNSVTYLSNTFDVTVNQALNQDDPTNVNTILYDIEFSNDINTQTLDASDFIISPSGTIEEIILTSQNTVMEFSVSVTDVNDGDTVSLSLPSGVVEDNDGKINKASTSTDNQVTFVSSFPTVTIDQDRFQRDPSGHDWVYFQIIFSEPINPLTFDYSDITLASTTGIVSSLTSSDNIIWDLRVDELSAGETVTANIAEGVVENLSGIPNLASTSDDNQVTYIPLTVTINQSSAQEDPTNTDLAIFEIEFSRDIDPSTFISTDITLSGTSGIASSLMTTDNVLWTFNVTGMANGDTVTAIIELGVVGDSNNYFNLASTSTDNQVTFNAPSLNVNIEHVGADPIMVDNTTFDVVFDNPIVESTLETADFNLTPSGTVTNIEMVSTVAAIVTVGNISDGDTITLSMDVGQVIGVDYGNLNLASTSTDNQVTFNAPPLNVNIEHIGADPILVDNTTFNVVFNHPITESTLETTDFTLSPSGTVTNIEMVSTVAAIMTVGNILDGDTITLSMNAGQVAGAEYGNLNLASTSTDNQVTYNTPPVIVATNPLNDTGITWGGDYPSGNNATCTSNITSPQDCYQGRDATHNDDSDGHAGFNFTKLDASGSLLAASASSWSCVKDNVTGLVWEVKSDDGGIHDKDNTYRWGGLTHIGNYGTEFYSDWDSLVNGSNNNSLCGFNDWRVPTRQELRSIVDFSRLVEPTIDIEYFPSNLTCDLCGYFWTSYPSPITNQEMAIYIDFLDGTSYPQYRNEFANVRLVR